MDTSPPKDKALFAPSYSGYIHCSNGAALAAAVQTITNKHMNTPFLRDKAIFVPTGKNAFKCILPEYQDSDVQVAGEKLDAVWGYPYYGGDYRHCDTENPEADLAAVMAVYERNTGPKGVTTVVTKLPPLPYADEVEVSVPQCRVELRVELDREMLERAAQVCSAVTPPSVLGQALSRHWGRITDTGKVGCRKFLADTMSEAVKLAEDEAASIRAKIRDHQTKMEPYLKLREENIAAADAAYERNASL